jgi:PAS domain S-box-containing protein
MERKKTDNLEANDHLKLMKLYQDLVETSQDLIWQCDEGCRYTYLNPAWELTFGYKIEEMLGKKFTEFQTPEYAMRDMGAFSRLMEGEPLKGYETVHIGRAGNNIHLVFNAKSVRSNTGDIIGTRGIAFDITEIKLVEERLRKSEAANRSIINSSPMGVHQYELMADGRLLFTGSNPAADKILGVDNAAFIGKTIEEAFPPLIHTEVPARYREVASTGVMWQTDQIDYRDEKIHGAFHVVAFRTGINTMTAMFLDITEQKQAEESLRKSEERFRAIFNSTFQFTGLMTPDGILVEVNRAALDFAGVTQEETINKPFWDTHWWKGNVSRVQQLKSAIRSAKEGEFVRYEVELQGRGETTAIIDFSLKPVFDSKGKVVLLVPEGRDITALKCMEMEVQRAQKLESLGILAGGIAHDFNNLMGGIFGYIDLAKDSSKEHHVIDYLNKAAATISRARSLTQQLLTFSKGGAPARKVGPLFPCIREAAEFAMSGSNVSLRLDIPENLWQCSFDSNQISQVIDNIVINALHSMPMGGSIEIAARNITACENEYTSMSKGDYVRISISDHGIGIPANLLPRIFDPFFTTKTKGHGLGLSTCYSIVSRHGGAITVESEPGKGSTFRIFLPAATGAEVKSFILPQPEIKGRGTIIVMDDDESIRDMLGRMLTSLGFHVKNTSNGKDALELLHQELKIKGSMTAMILDLTIPGGMGGLETIREIRKYYRGIPVFVASGYAEDPVMQSPSDYGFTGSICKPFMKKELVELLSKHI